MPHLRLDVLDSSMGVYVHRDTRVGPTDPSTRRGISNLRSTIRDHAAKESEAHHRVIDCFDRSVILDLNISIGIKPQPFMFEVEEQAKLEPTIRRG